MRSDFDADFQEAKGANTLSSCPAGAAGGVASTLLVFSDVTMGDPDNTGGVISKLSDGVGAVGDVPGHKVIAWNLPVREFNIQSQRVQSTQVP